MALPNVRLLPIAALAACALVAAAPALASPRLAGNVWIVDQEDGLVTIIDAGKKHTFSYGDDTVIRRGSTDRAITDLRRGDRIVVTLVEPSDGAVTSRARLIAIAGPPSLGRGLDIFQ